MTRDDTRSHPFATTRWTVVLSARERLSPESGAALESLCRTYWFPVYAFARRSGRSSHDAEDLTQAFFVRLMEKDWLADVAREKGRFRSFLMVAMKRFMANDLDRALAEKRGGGRIAPLDTGRAESRYAAEPDRTGEADRVYERRWALTLLERAMAALRAHYAESGRERDFEIMKPFLISDRTTVDHAAFARELGCSEGAARVALHRLRKRFRDAFREAVRDTVADPADFEDEMRHVVAVLAEG